MSDFDFSFAVEEEQSGEEAYKQKKSHIKSGKVGLHPNVIRRAYYPFFGIETECWVVIRGRYKKGGRVVWRRMKFPVKGKVFGVHLYELFAWEHGGLWRAHDRKTGERVGTGQTMEEAVVSAFEYLVSRDSDNRSYWKERVRIPAHKTGCIPISFERAMFLLDNLHINWKN